MSGSSNRKLVPVKLLFGYVILQLLVSVHHVFHLHLVVEAVLQTEKELKRKCYSVSLSKLPWPFTAER